jgi:protein-disulfide isomerase
MWQAQAGKIMKTGLRQWGRLLVLTAIAPLMIAAVPATNWALQFSQSASGGHYVGNPAAANKVIEFASYTCSHCAQFEAQDVPVLKRDYVAKGTVSFEIRNLVRDPVDLTVALLARCGGKGRFFGNHRHFMATQDQWMATASKISGATEAKARAGDWAGFTVNAYREMGLSVFAAQRGITDAQARTCLADRAALKAILDMTTQATATYKLTGTPGFVINGKVRNGVHDIASIIPYLTL